MKRKPFRIVLGSGVLGVLCTLLFFTPLHAFKQCQGTCRRTFYYKIKTITFDSITSGGQTVGKDDKNYENLVKEVDKRSMREDLKADLEKNGDATVECPKKNCTCAVKTPKWSDDDKKGTNKGSDSHSVTGHYAGTNQDYTWNFTVEYTAKQAVNGSCTGDDGDVSYTVPQDETAMTNLLPQGAVFAFAQVEQSSTIEVEEAGYAVVATADVVKTRRVNPGDKLDASTTSSIMFDGGTGMVVKVLEKTAPLTALVGLVPLLDQERSHPLPLNNGEFTTFIGSNKPFATPAISIDNVNKTPDATHAIVLNHDGGRVGQICTFKGVQLQTNTNLEVRTLDNNGAIVEQQKVTGGVLDGTPKVSFNKSVYKAGEKGTLQISNQENYQKVAETTRFNATGNVANRQIRLVPLTNDLKGLPATTSFKTTSLGFQTTHAGEARVAVYMPMAVPPRKKQPNRTEKNAALEESNNTFTQWLTKVGGTE